MTDCSSATDTVQDGKNGQIVKADVRELELAIRQMSDDRIVREMSLAAYDGFDEEDCSPETYVQNLVKVFGDR